MGAVDFSIPVIEKAPAAVLDYGFDLSKIAPGNDAPWLAPGETVTGLSVTVDEGITAVSHGIFNNAAGVPTVIVAWIAGGTVGARYAIHFQFTTSAGRTDVRSIILSVVDR